METIPVYTLVESLIAKGRSKNLTVALVETTGEIIAALEEQKDGK